MSLLPALELSFLLNKTNHTNNLFKENVLSENELMEKSRKPLCTNKVYRENLECKMAKFLSATVNANT